MAEKVDLLTEALRRLHESLQVAKKQESRLTNLERSLLQAYELQQEEIDKWKVKSSL